MKRNTQITITATAQIKDHQHNIITAEVELEPTCEQDIIDAIQEELRDNIDLLTEELEEQLDLLTIDDIKITSYGDLDNHSPNYQDLQTVYAINEADIDLDLDIILSYADNTSIDDLSNIEEAYAGQYNSGEAFAEDMADQLGYINNDVSWPYTCIDWEQAASELMYDYFESNGYYFRNL
jgi:antirestriction protein